MAEYDAIRKIRKYPSSLSTDFKSKLAFSKEIPLCKSEGSEARVNQIQLQKEVGPTKRASQVHHKQPLLFYPNKLNRSIRRKKERRQLQYEMQKSDGILVAIDIF